MLIKNYFNCFILTLGLIFLSVSCASFGGVGNYSSSDSEEVKKCNIDIECGVGKKCVSGVCTGGIAPSIRGECVTGNFGKRVCSNSGKSCNVDSQCLGP